MADYLNDHDGGKGTSIGENWTAVAHEDKTRRVNSLFHESACMKLHGWAELLVEKTGDSRPLPCTWEKCVQFVPQLEARIRELFPQALAVGKVNRGDIDVVFIDVGLQKIP